MHLITLESLRKGSGFEGNMEEPLQILRDALEICGLSLERIILVSAGLEHPEAILDMADWVADNPKASWSEMMKEKVRLIEQYEL